MRWGKLRGMTDDLLLLVLTAGVLAAGYKIWQLSLDARGVLIAVSGETRIAVDSTQSCP